MKRGELVGGLLHKAAQDEAVLEELLASPRIDDATIRFHAQQAVEKLLKAWLAHLGVDFPRVHRLETLVDLLAAHGHRLPDDVGELGRLTPFGTLYRYDDLPLPVDVDRREMLRLVRAVRSHVQSQVAGGAQ
jgi:HEPN domain-containing protein